MPAIMPVSDLRNYNEVLREVKTDSPVFLTKNGRGCYAILDIRDYERIEAEQRLARELQAGRASGEEKGWIPFDEVRASLLGGNA